MNSHLLTASIISATIPFHAVFLRTGIRSCHDGTCSPYYRGSVLCIYWPIGPTMGARIIPGHGNSFVSPLCTDLTQGERGRQGEKGRDLGRGPLTFHLVWPTEG